MAAIAVRSRPAARWHLVCLRESMANGPSLLLLDDETDILSGLARYFGARGFRVDCAAERETAEERLRQDSYDCVILDLGLGVTPGTTEGLDLIPFVRQLQPAATVVVFTAYGGAALEAEARRRGAHGFLLKPLPLAKLLAVVERLIGAVRRAGGR